MRVARDEDIRRELATWSPDELLDFAADCAVEFSDALDRLRRRASARSRDGSAAATFKVQIEQALDVRHVKWNEVAAFVASLEAILGDVVNLAETKPGEALHVALWFLSRVPGVCEAVDGEDELGLFCTEIGRAIVLAAAKARAPGPDVASSLLDAYVADRYGTMQDLPGIASELVTPATLGAFEAIFREKLGRQAAPFLKQLAERASRRE